MRDVVICEPVRTPVGRYGGRLKNRSAAELGATAVRGLLERTNLPPELVDDVVLGNCNPNSEAPAIGRVVAMDAGLPASVGGLQVDRRCGSGLQAIVQAALQVGGDMHDVVIAGGCESMSNASFYTVDARWGTAGAPSLVLHDSLARGRVTAGGRDHLVHGGMVETAENVRRQYRISREDQDELAYESHRRAVAAMTSGVFAAEIIPVEWEERGAAVVVDQDEHPRPDISREALARLTPMRRGVDPDATVTAGNASGQNDGAAVSLVTTPEIAERLGVTPLVRIVAAATAGVPADHMGIGPVPATERVLAKAGLTLADMDLIELNEAFASQVLAVTREWKFGASDFERLNVHGSGISLGHPVGATGARLVGLAARELARREGRYALVTLCIGGGQGMAAVLERFVA